MNTVIIVLIIIGTIYYFINKRNEYQARQHLQEEKIKELIQKYIQENIPIDKKIEFDRLITHLKDFYEILNNYSIYPNINNRVPFLFCEELHKYGYLNLNELITTKERLQNTIPNTTNTLSYLKEQKKNS